MKLILGTFTILLLFVQPCWLAAVGDVCQLIGKDLVIHRNYKTGETMCCLNVRCSRGQEPVLCDRDDPWSTTCRSCPDGTYQPEATDSVDMLHCNAKTQCYGNLSARHEKSKTRDTRCTCDPRHGVCNPAGVTKNPRSCIKKTCDPGYRLTSNCVCEVCVKPENKSKHEQKKPCDKKDRLCRNKRETSRRESDSSTICPEDNPKSEVETVVENKGNTENPGLMSSSSVVPYSSSSIGNHPSNGNHGGRDDVTSDHQNGDIPSDQVDKSISWYMVFILVMFVGGLVVMVVFCLVLRRRACFRKSDSSSSSGFKKSASSTVTNSTDDTDEIMIQTTSAESSHLMSHHSEAAPAVQYRADAATDNDVMKPSDKEKLTALRPLLVQSLIFCEYLWAILQSNETVTSEMKTQIERSNNSDPEKAGALITYLLKRNSHAFTTFVAALIYTKQEHLARALDRDLTVEIKEKCEEDDQLISYVHNLERSNSDICMGTSHS